MLENALLFAPLFGVYNTYYYGAPGIPDIKKVMEMCTLANEGLC